MTGVLFLVISMFLSFGENVISYGRGKLCGCLVESIIMCVFHGCG